MQLRYVAKWFQMGLFILAMNGCSAAFGWDSRTPLSYSSSFHSLLAGNNQSALVQSQISKQCLSSIKRHLKQGGNFYSQVAVDFSETVGNFPVRTVSDGYLYHYTNAVGAYRSASNGDMNEIFRFLRGLEATSSWYFYVASDRASSEGYGKYGIRIHLHPKALIFMRREGVAMGGLPDRLREIREMVEDELVERDPGLNICRGEGLGQDARTPSMLMNLALEASRISAIAYIGFENEYPSGICKVKDCVGRQWLQIVGPWAMMDVGTFEK